MKTLYLVRHAKSSWDDPGLDDRDRPLNKRGRRNAPEMGARLHQRSARVDRVISSPALRAHTTARVIANAIGYPESSIELDEALYFDGYSGMLEILHRQPESVDSLALAGHNPDITSFLNFLCGYQTDNLPTCAVATMVFDKPWDAIGEMDGKLLDVDYPKKRKV